MAEFHEYPKQVTLNNGVEVVVHSKLEEERLLAPKKLEVVRPAKPKLTGV